MPKCSHCGGSGQEPRKSSKTTWLTPYFDAWKDRFGAQPNAGKLSKALRQADKEHGPEYLVPRFKAFLAESDAKFVNPFRFAETHGEWGNGNGAADIGSQPHPWAVGG